MTLPLSGRGGRNSVTFPRPQFRRQRPGSALTHTAIHNTLSDTHAPVTRTRHAAHTRATRTEARTRTVTHTRTHTGRKIPDRGNCLLTLSVAASVAAVTDCHLRGRPMIMWKPIATAVPCPRPQLACVPCYVHVSKACSHQWHRLLPLRLWHQFTLPARTAIRF